MSPVFFQFPVIGILDIALNLMHFGFIYFKSLFGHRSEKMRERKEVMLVLLVTSLPNSGRRKVYLSCSSFNFQLDLFSFV